HPDFYRENPGLTTGMVKSTLDSDGLPEWSGMSTQTIADSRTQFQPGGNYAPPAEWTWFKMWYRDHPVFNRTIIDNITLTELPNGAFQFDTTSFFPLDDLGFGNSGYSGYT